MEKKKEKSDPKLWELEKWTMVADDEKQSIEHILDLEEENKVIKEEKEMLIRQNTLLQESNKKLREEVEQLKNQRIFNSTEYDLITLTSTTPQWELRRK